MKNILSIYKLNLPFGEGSLYDRTKYESICHELEFFLKYDWSFVSEKIEKYTEFEVCELEFTGGLIKIIFYYEKHHYFLPSFQLDLTTDNVLDKKFLQSFYKIFTNLGWGDYIFDLISDKLNVPESRIITDNVLAQNFKTFDYKILEDFLTNLDPMFVEERLYQNPIMKQHLYYLIFLNYKLFKNILFMDWGILDLEKLLWEDIDDNLKTELAFTKERITHVWEINIAVFKKYKEMLETLLSIITK